MSLQDPLSDLFSRIRNAQMRKKSIVSSPVSKLREKRFGAIKTNIVGTTIKLQKDVSKSLEIFATAESKIEKRPRLRKVNSATVSSRLFPGIHAGANFTLSRIYSLPTKKPFKRVNLNLEISQDKFLKEFRANKLNNASIVESPFIGHFFSLNSQTKSLVSKQPNLGKIKLRLTQWNLLK